MYNGEETGLERRAPSNLRNDDWAYAATSKPLMENFTKCRACHRPPAQKDFVHRYDEYFEKRGRMEPRVTGFIRSWERGCKLTQYTDRPIHRSTAMAPRLPSL